jgi:Rad3-related DNA helicase
MTGNLAPRKVLVVDEAHKLQGILLDHLKIRFKVRRKVDPKEYADFTKTEHWADFLRAPEQIMVLGNDPDVRDSWIARLERLEKLGDTIWKTWDDPDDKCLWLEIGPLSVANQAKWLLWDNAEIVVLMSGTILDKDSYCRGLGIKPDEALFVDLPSDFPVENRPVYLPQTDIVLDYKNFDKNIAAAAKEVNRIVSLPENANVKCLIHTNSYRHAKELMFHCKNHRMIGHTSETFHQALSGFVTGEGNQIMSDAYALAQEILSELEEALESNYEE